MPRYDGPQWLPSARRHAGSAPPFRPDARAASRTTRCVPALRDPTPELLNGVTSAVLSAFLLLVMLVGSLQTVQPQALRTRTLRSRGTRYGRLLLLLLLMLPASLLFSAAVPLESTPSAPRHAGERAASRAEQPSSPHRWPQAMVPPPSLLPPPATIPPASPSPLPPPLPPPVSLEPCGYTCVRHYCATYEKRDLVADLRSVEQCMQACDEHSTCNAISWAPTAVASLPETWVQLLWRSTLRLLWWTPSSGAPVTGGGCAMYSSCVESMVDQALA